MLTKSMTKRGPVSNRTIQINPNRSCSVSSVRGMNTTGNNKINFVIPLNFDFVLIMAPRKIKLVFSSLVLENFRNFAFEKGPTT